jgi:small subunit ribosomal protein S20
MANHASALKAHRQSIERRERNRSQRSRLRTELKRLDDRLQEGKIEEAKQALPQVYAAIDKSIQKGVLSENAAARQKSRLTRRVNSAGVESATQS